MSEIDIEKILEDIEKVPEDVENTPEIIRKTKEDVETNGPKDLPAVGGKVSDWKASRKEVLVLLCLSVICLMVSLDSTIFVPVLPVIAKDLHGDATSTFWVGSAYLLPCAAFQPINASLSDIFGRKKILFTSLFLFLIGSIVGGVAQNITTVLAGRVIQGIGGGGLIPVSMIVLTDLVPLRQRPRYAAIIQVSIALGTILGPLIGGLFVEHTGHTSWRWVFYLNLPLCVVSGVMLFTSLKLQQGEGKLHSFDFIGGVLFISSLTSFLIAISWGGVQFPWDSYHTLVPLCLGAAGIFATGVWERYGTQHPFLRLSILKNRSSLAVYGATLVQGILMYGELYYVSIYLQSAKGLSPVRNGIGLLPVSVALMPSSVIVAFIISKLGLYRWALWLGWVVTITASGVAILLHEHTITVAWIAILSVVGLGHGILFNALLVAAQAASPASDVAYAASMYTFFRTLGFAFGVTIGATTLQNLMASNLKSSGLPIAIASDAAGYVSILQAMPAGSPMREKIISAYVYGSDGVFEVLTGIAGLGLLATFFVSRSDMDIELSHV